MANQGWIGVRFWWSLRMRLMLRCFACPLVRCPGPLQYSGYVGSCILPSRIWLPSLVTYDASTVTAATWFHPQKANSSAMASIRRASNLEKSLLFTFVCTKKSCPTISRFADVRHWHWHAPRRMKNTSTTVTVAWIRWRTNGIEEYYPSATCPDAVLFYLGDKAVRYFASELSSTAFTGNGEVWWGLQGWGGGSMVGLATRTGNRGGGMVGLVTWQGWKTEQGRNSGLATREWTGNRWGEWWGLLQGWRETEQGRYGGVCYKAGGGNGTGEVWLGLLPGWGVNRKQGRYGGFATGTQKSEGGMVGLATRLGRGTRNRGGMVGMLQGRERGTGNGGHNEESFIPAPHEPDPDATSDNIPTPQARRFPCLLIPR